jgi:nitroreductase
MTAAIWAPSGSNSQPWRFYVATGAKRDELVQALIEATGPEAPSAEAYDELIEGVEKIRSEFLKKDDWAETGLRRMSREGADFIRFGSLRFYEAPVIIIVAKPESIGGSSRMSIGAAVQNILLAAHAEGLATCWLGMPLIYGDRIKEVLDIPADEVLVTSISMGYPDKDSPINSVLMARESFEKTVHLLD